mmetsp:Transcript_91302/g.295259  ORF Transcript_91302/g.295259 Transcript_91302/m.295259 type:complete len:232 (-) Transcript_91302:47-742(-)
MLESATLTAAAAGSRVTDLGCTGSSAKKASQSRRFKAATLAFGLACGLGALACGGAHADACTAGFATETFAARAVDRTTSAPSCCCATMLPACARLSYFRRANSTRSSLEASGAGFEAPYLLSAFALPISRMLWSSSSPHRYVPEPLTFEMCVPIARCTSAQRTQRKTPRFTLAHGVPLSPHSAQRALEGSLRNRSRIWWCSRSRRWISSMAYFVPSLLVHMAAIANAQGS